MSTLLRSPYDPRKRLGPIARRALLPLAIVVAVGATGVQATGAQASGTLELRVSERALSPKCPGTFVHKVAPGASVCFEVVVKVKGPGAVASGAALTGITLTDEFPFTAPRSAVIAGGGAKCSAAANPAGGDTVTCSIAAIAQDKDAIVTLTGSVPANATSGTRYKNTVSVKTASTDELAATGSRLTAVSLLIVGTAIVPTTAPT
ncbi:MAG TPA: hypothetical protein VME46_16375 [Acidimicrobiales bacterium]|nr:hypothetical protein [Acidimicrobiales bacterium]